MTTHAQIPLPRLFAALAVTVLLTHSSQGASTGDVFEFRLPAETAPGWIPGNPENIYGTASLERATELGPNGQPGLILTMDTTALVPGDAYTMWAVLFNNPDACPDGCNGPDLAIPEVEGGLVFATGKVVEAAADVFTAFLELGHPAGEVLLGSESGLTNLRAEVHGVIRSHGPASDNADLLDLQVTTFGGGCATFAEGGALNPDSGFLCHDGQAAILAPVPEPSSVLLAAFGIALWSFTRRTMSKS